MNDLRLGVVGIGNMGSTHANNIYNSLINGAKLTAVCDVKEERLIWAREVFQDVKIYNDYKEMIDSGEIDAVIIATPHYLHPVIACYAFSKNLHVLTEKPAGVFTKKVEEMNRLAEQSGKVFAIMYNQRTNPLFVKARELVHSGELGSLKRAVWIITNWYRRQEYYDSGEWRATWKDEGGGVLINQCPHNIDIMQWIVGMPIKVTGHCYYGKYHDIEVEDDVTAFFEYENGATGVFITTTGENPGTNRFEISLDKGKIVMENGKLCLWKYNVPESEYRYYDGEEFKKVECEYTELDQNGVKRGSAHARILQNFVNSILYGEELIAPGCDGIKGLSVSNAIHLSDWTKKTVELPIDASLYKELLEERIKNSSGKGKIETDKTINIGQPSSRWEVNW